MRYGPHGTQIEALLARARRLTHPEIEVLGRASGRVCRGAAYAEALLALRRAAEDSGRGGAVGLAGGRAETLIVDVAAARCPTDLDDRARWQTIAEQAAWGAGDAARALVVGDLLSESHLRVLTLAWRDVEASAAS